VWIQAQLAQPGRFEVHFGDGAFAEAEGRFAEVLDCCEEILGGERVEVVPHADGRTWLAADTTSAVGSALTYGPFGGGERRSLLRYHAKGAPDLAAAGVALGLRFELTAEPAEEGAWILVRARFDGEPAAGAELVFLPERSRDSVRLELDEHGELRLPAFGDGPLQLRAGWRETVEPFQHEGEELTAIQHYTTLLVSQAGPAEVLPDGSDRWAWQRLRRAGLCHSSGVAALPAGPLGWSLRIDGVAFEGRLALANGRVADIQWPAELDGAQRERVSETFEAWFDRRADFEAGRVPSQAVRFGAPLVGRAGGPVIALDDAAASRWWLRKDQLERLQRREGELLRTWSFLEHEADEEGNTLPRRIHEVNATWGPDSAIRSTALHTDRFTDLSGVLAPSARRTELFHGDRLQVLELALQWPAQS
ncbi:MAG: hypothetical protein ACYS26_12695, partial [Planctomycetota bacterium]